MVELTAAERAQVDAIGQKLFDWERTVQEHSAMIRADPNAYAEACQQYAAAQASPIIGSSMPARDKYEELILLGEQILEKECVTPYDHLNAARTSADLCRLQRALNTEFSRPIQLAIAEYVNAKYVNQPNLPSSAVVPQNPHPLMKAEHFGSGSYMPSEDSDSSDDDWPPVLFGKPFSSSDIEDCPTTEIFPAELAHYKSHPEVLLNEMTFMSSDRDMGEEGFRVSCILTRGKDAERVFYVIFADEGKDAFGHSSEHFFEMLETSKRVITESSD